LGLIVSGFYQAEVVYLVENNPFIAIQTAHENLLLEKWLLDLEKHMFSQNKIIAGRRGSYKVIYEIMAYFKFYENNNIKKYMTSTEFFSQLTPQIHDKVLIVILFKRIDCEFGFSWNFQGIPSLL
jgi:hypothetical protein